MTGIIFWCAQNRKEKTVLNTRTNNNYETKEVSTTSTRRLLCSLSCCYVLLLIFYLSPCVFIGKKIKEEGGGSGGRGGRQGGMRGEDGRRKVDRDEVGRNGEIEDKLPAENKDNDRAMFCACHPSNLLFFFAFSVCRR